MKAGCWSSSLPATDSDLPRQRLTYRLEGPVPAGMSLHPDSGAFLWRPTDVQGGTTNRITIVVTDDGVPPLSARQSFQLVVRDTRSDFALQLGTTNLLSGATDFIPITLRSQASLTNLSFVVDSPVGRISQLAVGALVPQLAHPFDLPRGTHQVRIQLGAAPGQILPGDADLARLQFTADREAGSAVLPLRLKEVTG